MIVHFCASSKIIPTANPVTPWHYCTVGLQLARDEVRGDAVPTFAFSYPVHVVWHGGHVVCGPANEGVAKSTP